MGYKVPPMNSEQRLQAFRKFVEKSPADPFARYSLAMALRGASQAEEAVSEFRELASRVPDYVPTYLMLGQVLEALGRDADAARAYEDGIAAAIRKQDGHAQNELSQALEAVRSRGAVR
jgi:predicted Zn-dependent protease